MKLAVEIICYPLAVLAMFMVGEGIWSGLTKGWQSRWRDDD